MLYLLDTTVLIDYFRGQEKIAHFFNSISQQIISAVTVGEVLQGAQDIASMRIIKDTIKHFLILPITPEITWHSLELLDRYTLSHGLLILDAFIAATALEHDLTLVSSNKKHFSFIPGLKFVSQDSLITGL